MLKRFARTRRRTDTRCSRIEALCGLSVTAAAVLLYSAGAFESLELSLFDVAMRLRGALPSPPEIALIEIDQESVQSIGTWPLPRDVYARLFDALAGAGVAAVGTNVFFSEESVPEKDRELAAAIGRAGMVYLPCVLESAPGSDRRIRLIRNIPALREAAKAEGLVNMPADPDGVTRRVSLESPFEEARHWQLAFLLARDRFGADASGVSDPSPRFVELRASGKDAIVIPLDRTRAMVIDWNGPWARSYLRYSLADVLESAAPTSRGSHPRVPLEALRGRICLVGPTMPGAFDALRTPFEAGVPSIAVHANIISQILSRRFVTPLPRTRNLAAIVLAGLAVSLAVPRLRPGTAMAATLGACACYAAFFFFLYLRCRIQAAVLCPIATALAAYLAMSIRHEIHVSMERARLLALATTDGLTGLYAVGHTRLLLEAEIAESLRRRSPLSLIMADVDHFKEVNDSWGHPAGDLVLKEIAKMLMASCRELDIVGRYGGEEFILVLPDTGLAAAKGVAERIRSTAERLSFAHGGREHPITVSLGVTELSEFDTAAELIRRADEALYAAKRAGRNRVCIGDPAPGREETIGM